MENVRTHTIRRETRKYHLVPDLYTTCTNEITVLTHFQMPGDH